MLDPLVARYRLGNIVGNPDFERGLQMYTTELMRMVTDLHRNGVYDFGVKVITGDTVELTFYSEDDVTLFRLRYS